jgi:hypothetical protein
LVDIGFLSDEEQSFLKEKIPWAEATQKILGASSSNEKDLVWAISSKVTFKDTEEQERLLAGLKWIGIFSSEIIIPRGQSPSFFSLPVSASRGLRWMVLLQIVPRSSVVFPKQSPMATYFSKS